MIVKKSIIKFHIIVLIFILLLSPILLADDYIEESSDYIFQSTNISEMNFQLLSRHIAVYERNSNTFLFEKSSNEKSLQSKKELVKKVQKIVFHLMCDI